MNFRQQLAFNLGRNPAYQEFRQNACDPTTAPVRLIAYYLPQFHPIPQNDAWWGRGFTEWTNVTRALPRFVGHYQPHLPGDLGFYDLRLPDILRQQAEIARNYGVYGFCFHHYWFAGENLLDTPLRNLLANPDIELPFCINWANESWTRTWSGDERQILIQQAHSPEDDIAFARSIEPALRDRRYITVGGRPLVMLYRPSLLPDAAATLVRWREHFARAGIADPYFVMVQAFDDHDPRRYGFDAAAQFPPHKLGWGSPNLTPDIRKLDRQFRGTVKSYDQMALNAMADATPPFRLLRGVCPSWDNEARRPGGSTVLAGASPEKYAAWLDWTAQRMVDEAPADERIVFANAWNEWAEGAHLEPDRHYGYAYLSATADALAGRVSAADRATFAANGQTTGCLRPDQMTQAARAKAMIKRLRAQ